MKESMSIQSASLSFYHLGLSPNMLKVIDGMKFVTPTPIQHKAIPIALEGKDVVGIAQTGTGKTLAFGIPMIQRISSFGGRGLIVVPTRELALQVDEVLRKVLPPFNLISAVLIGGAPMFSQIKALRRRPHIIIATPGRLNDHIEQRTADVSETSILVLDEADRMFDMGFAPQVERILSKLPRKRQTMLFSATMPPGIVNLASRHMKLPMSIEIAPSGTVNADVTQELFIVPEESKKNVVRVLLAKYSGSVILFTRTKAKAMRVTRALREMGHDAVEIHSDRSMGQRKQAMEGFKNGRYRILVATDIASRGIDVSMIELVINYDLPEDAENYVHRIGRTARAGQTGTAVTLATPDQGSDVARIEKLIRKSLNRAQHPDIPAQDFSYYMGGSKQSSRGRSMRSFRPRRR